MDRTNHHRDEATTASDASALPHKLALRILSERVSDGITILDADGRVVYTNEATARRAGYESADEMLHDPDKWRDRLRFTDLAGRPVDLNEFPGRRILRGEHPEPLFVKSFDRVTRAVHWVRIQAEPFRGPDGRVEYVVDTIQDVTDRIMVEQQATRRVESQAFLIEAARTLGASLDFDTTVQRVADLVVPRLADWCVVDLLEPDGTLRPAALAHTDPELVRVAEDLRRRFPPDPRSEVGAWAAIRTGGLVTYEVTDEVLDASGLDGEHRDTLRTLGVRSVVVVPLQSRGRCFGALTLVWGEHGRTQSSEDLAAAEELGLQAALAIENARLYATRDSISRALQTALLPRDLPRVPGFDLAARYWPAGPGLEVGGDFYDAFDRSDGALGLVVGDVCGKGAEAAAIMGIARQTVRAAGVLESRPSAILAVLNQALLRDQTDLFCTACDVRIRPMDSTARVTVSLAGHPRPFVVRADGRVERTGIPGSLVGVLPEPKLVDATDELGAGDSIVLFTDGLVERRRENLQPALAELLSAHAGESAAEIVRAIADWHDERPSSDKKDDAVVLVASFVPSGDA
jgi:serine phosphatase RsbU (regulator of sigma subunit)